MFSIFKSKEEMQLEAIMNRIETNMANNYKDNAQEALKEFEEKLKTVTLNGKKKNYYQSCLD